MSGRWAQFGRMDESPACARGEHGGCAHFVAVGGGINPRRLRLEAGAGLCPCSCHSSCPVALSGREMTVPLETWRESCTCPGAGQERRRLEQDGADLRGFGERWEERRRLTRARREAFQAARARAVGKTRDEIREIYQAELYARDLPVPGGAVLDAIIDSISGNPLPAARLATESLVQAGRTIGRLSRQFRSGS